MSLTLTQEAVTRYVRTRLGAPIVEVELTDEMIAEITQQALKIYGMYEAIEKFGQINVIAGQQKYDLSEAEIGKGIVEVFRPNLMRQHVSLDQFDVFKQHTFTPNLDPGDYYAERMWWNEVRRSAGSDDDYEVIMNRRTRGATLYINPIPSESYTLSYIYFEDVTLEDLADTDEWLRDYTLACCMETLGMIRNKYKGVQGAESSIEMDGSELIAKGAEEKKAMEEYLMKRGQIVAPIRG